MFHRARGLGFATDGDSQYLLSCGTSFLASASPDIILGLKSGCVGPGEPEVSRQQRCWFIPPAFLQEFQDAAGPKARAGLCPVNGQFISASCEQQTGVLGAAYESQSPAGSLGAGLSLGHERGTATHPGGCRGTGRSELHHKQEGV